MHGANAHYGHRAVLTAYAGVAGDLPLPGLLQHGWNYDLGAVRDDVLLPAPDPFFVWSDRNLRNCRNAGLTHVSSIGSPFLYLPPLPQPPQPEPGSLLALPIHGWERQRIAHDFQNYCKALLPLRSQFRKITVCMYWFDLQFPENREVFEREGIDVVTAGHRDGNPRFLHGMRDLLLQYETLTTNRAQTGLFYALSLGLKAFLHGPRAGVETSVDPSGQLFDAWQAQEFPQLLWKNFQGDPHRDLGLQELGQAHVLSPENLRKALLWEPEHRAELERRAQAFRIRTSKGARRQWYRWTGRLAAATSQAAPVQVQPSAAPVTSPRPQA